MTTKTLSTSDLAQFTAATTGMSLNGYLTFPHSRHMLIANFGERESGPLLYRLHT